MYRICHAVVPDLLILILAATVWFAVVRASHSGRHAFCGEPTANQARNVPSSSFSAHLMTSSSFSLPCVNLATITVLIA